MFTLSNNLVLYIDEPTRITSTTATILDQFISNIPGSVKDVEVLAPISTCDHCPIKMTVLLKSKFNKPRCYYRHIWQYNNADFDMFRHQLQNTDWDVCFDDDINKSCANWTTTFLNVARQCIPNKVVTIHPCDKIFFTAELRRLRRKKNRLHRTAKEKNTLHHWTQFRETRNIYNLKIREAKSKAELKNAELLKDPNNINAKKWWKLAMAFIRKDDEQASCYPPLIVNDDLIMKTKQKLKHSICIL